MLGIVAFNSAESLANDISFLVIGYDYGVINNFLVFNFIALELFVTGGMASIINANTAFMGVIVSSDLFVYEFATWNRVVGVIIGVASVAIAIGVTPLLKADTSNLFLKSCNCPSHSSLCIIRCVWGKLKLSECVSSKCSWHAHMFVER